MPELYVPHVNYETLVLTANQVKSSSPQKFRNTTKDVMWVKYLMFDDQGNSIHVRFGLRGGKQHVESFTHFYGFHNLMQMDAAELGASPLLRLDVPILIPPSQGFTVELEDTVGGGVRNVNVMMIGRRIESGGPFVLADRVAVPSSGIATANLQSDQAETVAVHDFCLRIEETGTAAKLRGILLKVSGGGLANWMPQKTPGNLVFPHRNPACAVFKIPSSDPRGVPLRPTEGFNFELRDVGGAGGTVSVGIIGYATDRS